MIYLFDNCELDASRVILRRDGVEVRIEPQVFDLLRCLLDRRGEVVHKEKLLDEIWGSRFVSESALTTRIKSLRQAVGDDGTRQKIIRTVHGKGYEFVADVHVVDDPSPVGAARQGGVPDAPVSRLPAAVQPLIGRAELLGLLRSAVANSRLVTLAGPGGVGKTSLGYELARMVEADFVDGAYAVELVTVVDEDATLEALATALDVNTRQQLSIDDAIVEMLRPRRALLLLDNCEHLVEPLAALVNRILRAAPGVSILATSREALAVAGEHVWTIEPLPFATGPLAEPDLAKVPAVALFLERAREADPRFRLDESTAPAVTEICRRLDGIPLAIELAAARVRVIDVVEIARRLDERFRLLKGVRRGGDPRHRTLEDAISWSYDMLSPDEQHLFAALAVFAGQFDLEAAEQVYGGDDDVLDLLTRLTERSMLAVRRPSTGGTRYELLETLREYGRSRLAGDRNVRLLTAHAAHHAAVARSVADDLQTPEEGPAVSRADASFADLRAAQRFTLQIEDADTTFELIGSLREYAMRTMRYEVFTWADQAVRLDAAGHPLYPLVTGIRAYGAWVRGEFDTAVALAHEARQIEEADGHSSLGLVERVLANVLCTVGNLETGLQEMRLQVDLAEASGNGSRVAHACYMGSVAFNSVGAYDEASRLIARAREAGGRTGSPTDLASASVAEGFAASQDDEAALGAFATAERLASSAGNRWMAAFARTEASGLLVHRGELVAGCQGLAEMVDTWYRAGEWSQQWHTLSRCVIALDRIGQAELAAQVVGAIETHATMGTPPVMVSLRDLALETREALVGRLGAERFDELVRAGASLPVTEVVHRTRSALLGRQIED